MASSQQHQCEQTRQSHVGPSLVTHARLLAFADDSPSIIRVRDLQVTLKGPKDAWGRTGKLQPALVNVEVRMRKAFGESSETDEVKGDTVHYGLLAKEVLKLIEEDAGAHTLEDCVAGLWSRLTGFLDMRCTSALDGPAAFLRTELIAYLRVSITMTKASLLGEGVTISWAAAFNQAAEQPAVNAASSLSIEGLRVPVLVGVNSNERTAKQIVLANLFVEEISGLADDLHPDLEAVIVQEMSDSHFETLEALAQSVMEKLKKRHAEQWKDEAAGKQWLFGLELRKPIAVPLAEAACVELRERTCSN